MKFFERVKHIVQKIVDKATGYDESYFEDSYEYESSIQMPRQAIPAEATPVTPNRPFSFSNPNAFPASAGEAIVFTEPIKPEPEVTPVAPATEPYAETREDLDDMFSTYGLKPSELQDEADDLFNPNDYEPENGAPVVLKRRPGYTDHPFDTAQNTPAIMTQNGVATVTSDKKTFWQKWGALIMGLAGVLFLILVVAFFVNLGSHKTAPQETTVATTAAETTTAETTAAETTTTETTALAVMPTTWQMVEGTYENNRWFPEGIQEIGAAKTDKEAFDAAYIWLEKVKTDPNLLVGAVKVFLDQDLVKTDLVNADGWATDKAVQLVSEIQLVFAQAKITPSQAPANGYNSGVNDGTVVVAENPGITGNTAAIQVETDDGKDTWILDRCGNTVTSGKPDVPTGKTDETPTPTPTPTPTLTPKDPAKDPAAQSKAPEGSGVNVDPGPGDYIAPTDMATPPAESRVNPSPPPAATTTATTAAPTTAATTTKAPVATPTPMPTPVPVAETDPTQVGTIPQPEW